MAATVSSFLPLAVGKRTKERTKFKSVFVRRSMTEIGPERQIERKRSQG
jgi:hypothetical protein